MASTQVERSASPSSETESCQGSPKKRKYAPISRPPTIPFPVAKESDQEPAPLPTAEVKEPEPYQVIAQSLWDYHTELGSLNDAMSDEFTKEQWAETVKRCLPILAGRMNPGLMPGGTNRPITPQDASDKSGWVGDCVLVSMLGEDSGDLTEYMFPSELRWRDLLAMAVYDDKTFNLAFHAVKKVAAKYDNAKFFKPRSGYHPDESELAKKWPRWATDTRSDIVRVNTGTCHLHRIVMYSWR